MSNPDPYSDSLVGEGEAKLVSLTSSPREITGSEITICGWFVSLGEIGSQNFAAC
jgi:hypothetical protein